MFTANELESMDSLSFTLRILTERRRGLNPTAPLARKINRAVCVLEELQEISSSMPSKSLKEAVFLTVQRENTLDDIKRKLTNDSVDLQGLTADEILLNAEAMQNIVYRINALFQNNGYWDDIGDAIEAEVRDIVGKA